MPADEDLFLLPGEERGGLQDRIRAMIAEAILSRRLAPGDKLPSTRRMAKRFDVSRVTVTLAYQALIADGYLETRARSGAFVAPEAPIARLKPSRPSDTKDASWPGRMRTNFADAKPLPKRQDWRAYPYPFLYGQADPSLFNLSDWRACALKAMSARDFDRLTGDFSNSDDPLLIEQICARTLPRRGVAAEPREVLVTLGAQHALWLAAEILLRGGGRAAIETPGYPDLRETLRLIGAEVTAIPVDAEGLPPEALPRGLDAAFVTPSHQAPSAATLPMARRKALLERAEADDFIIVEDDYDFEMSFLKPPLPALKSLDARGRVIYVGSFSKSLFPGLRLGYLVGPAPFIAEARALRALMLRHPPGLAQRTTAYFLALGHYDALIRRLRGAFAKRREVARTALAEHGLAVAGAPAFGGASFWIEGPDGLDAGELADRLLKDGVAIEPGAPFFAEPDPPRRFFRLAYSSIPSERIGEGVRRIAIAASAGNWT